jgi:transcription elongation GreA/GreB family factor
MFTATAPTVGVGSSVTVRDLRNRDEFTLTIVPSDHPLAFDPDQIMADSAVAQALLGSRIHDTVAWPTPQGLASFRVTAIAWGTP